ncbi:hypothetical protein ACWGKS_18835 [Nocardiopsis sp. NPDC055879]
MAQVHLFLAPGERRQVLDRVSARLDVQVDLATDGVGHDIPGPVRHGVAAEIRALADHAPGPVGPR